MKKDEKGCVSVPLFSSFFSFLTLRKLWVCLIEYNRLDGFKASVLSIWRRDDGEEEDQNNKQQRGCCLCHFEKSESCKGLKAAVLTKPQSRKGNARIGRDDDCGSGKGQCLWTTTALSLSDLWQKGKERKFQQNFLFTINRWSTIVGLTLNNRHRCDPFDWTNGQGYL